MFRNGILCRPRSQPLGGAPDRPRGHPSPAATGPLINVPNRVDSWGLAGLKRNCISSETAGRSAQAGPLSSPLAT
jgi:hypothetical protein